MIHIYICVCVCVYTVPQIFFPYTLKDIEYNSLSCTVEPCLISILYIWCVFANPKLLIYPSLSPSLTVTLSSMFLLCK